LELVRKEGKRNVKRKIEFYNLDAIISVGFRVNTKRGIEFRQWLCSAAHNSGLLWTTFWPFSPIPTRRASKSLVRFSENANENSLNIWRFQPTPYLYTKGNASFL
jgi:hypothetical protein